MRSREFNPSLADPLTDVKSRVLDFISESSGITVDGILYVKCKIW